MRTNCTYCKIGKGVLIINKDKKAESSVLECQTKKCKACWSNEISYKEHI